VVLGGISLTSLVTDAISLVMNAVLMDSVVSV
jgi:hypothetical protein